MTTNASAQTNANPPAQISVSQILGMLEGGKTREQIREELNLTPGELITVFKHPQLKGRKTHSARATRFELIDDVSGTERAQEPVTRTRSPRAATPEAQAQETEGNTSTTEEAAAEATNTGAAQIQTTEEATPAEEVDTDANSWDV